MFHRSNKSYEAKQEEAKEAAQDPQNPTTSEDAQAEMIKNTKAAGGQAFQFNPDASPEEKAAQARARVPENFHHEHKHNAATLVTDEDDGTAPKYDLPTPTTAGALETTSEDGKPVASGEKVEDLRWSRDRTGWAPRFGNGDPADDEGATLLDHQTWMEGKLDDKWFGDWYYNAGVIAFACLSTYIATLLGGGLMSLFVIMGFCATYYRTSLRRVRRNFRDDVHREMAKARLESDTESLEWINSFLVKFWPIFAPVLCDTIINAVDQVLSTATPAFLDSLRMKTFILGTKPPRLEHVKTYIKTEEDTVLMDWKFSFNPNDTADMTARQLKNKINPKVALEVRIGKGYISKGLDVIVEDFAFSGLMRVKVKLQIPFPHVEKAEICFLDRPAIDYVCKPLGGDTFGFDINFIPGLESFIQEQIHANLAPIMYAPNVFPIEIAKMLSGDAVDQAIGVLQITLHGAQGLKNPDKFPGIPDPYATLGINGRDVLAKSKTVTQNSNPRWNETKNIIITSTKDNLTLSLFDYNEYRKDKELGVASFALERVEAENEHENLQLEVMAGGRSRGVVTVDVRFFPVLEPAKKADGTLGPVPESNTGIAKFTVEQAKELDGSKSLIGQLNPYAVLLLNGKEIQTSQKLKRTNNPIWPNAMKEVLITDRQTAKLGLVIKDDRDFGGDPILGTYQVKLNDMIELMERGQEWYNLAGTKTGRAKMMLQWKPVALKGGVSSGGYVTPVGVMRFHFHNARGLRNLETMGKSDPYVRVLLSGVPKGRTVTFQNNLDPDFDEILYVPVHSTREKLTVEVMDSESLGSDRSLGLVEIAASEYVVQAESGEYLEHDEKRQRSDTLKLGGKGSPKGTLNYTVAFYPTIPTVDPEEEEKEKAASRPNGHTPKPSVESAALDTTRKSTDSARQSLEKTPATPGVSGATFNRMDRSMTATSMRTLGRTDEEVSMAKKLAEGEKEQDEVAEVQTGDVPKIKLSAEDLGQYESGLLVFKLMDGEMSHRDSYLEILMDDMLYPSYASSKIKEKTTSFNETGDVMVRELEVSKITMRIMQHISKQGEAKEDHVVAKLTGQTIDVLRRGLYQKIPLVLKGDDGREDHINVMLKYLPIKMRLDPSESINNMGTLRVEVHDAADLPAADRNGFSDPYCRFLLNDKPVHKTAIQKKTLHPAWNETFEVSVKSRTAAKFRVECYDWDRGGSDDSLGSADINLEILEPFQSQEVTLGLDGKSGSVRLHLLFKPDFITRSRQGTSTFQGTFAVPGKVIGAPVKGVGKGAIFVGGNVLRGATFVGRGFRRRKNGDPNEDVVESVEDPAGNRVSMTPPSMPKESSDNNRFSQVMQGSPQHLRQPSQGAESTTSGVAASIMGADPSEMGIANFSIVSASGYDATNLMVTVRQQTSKGMKDVHKTKKIKAAAGTDASWDEAGETFKVRCTPDTRFAVLVRDVHTFGADHDLGEGMLFVADAAGGAAGSSEGAAKTVHCGSGTVVVKSNFQHLPSTDGASLAETTSSPGRARSKLFKSPRADRDSRASTPAA